MRTLLVSVLLVFLSPVPAGAGFVAEEAFRFRDPRITESSGVSMASRTPGIAFTHNDSGDTARFFAVDASTGATVATYTVPAAAATDWEDMTSSGGHLFFGDIGDNATTRRQVTVYEIEEPVGASRPLPLVAEHTLRYPDRPHDAEALLVDPATGRLVIVTKEASGVSLVFRAPASGEVMELLGVVPLASLDPPVLGSRLVTGADVSADGTRVVVRTYTSAFEWDVPPGGLADAFTDLPLGVTLPPTVQGEAITYEGDDLLTTSEGSGAPAHRLRRTA